jgi:glycosyltransferase 2 family protein
LNSTKKRGGNEEIEKVLYNRAMEKSASLQTPSARTLMRRLIPGVLLGFLALVGIGLAGDLQQVGQQIRQFNWWMFPAALGFTLFNYTLRFLKWHYYIRQIGAKDLPWPQSLRLFIAGFPLAVTPGKVGEALKGVWLKSLAGVPVARGISVVVAERISDGLAVLGLSTIGVIAYPQYWPAFLLILIGLLAVVIVSQIRPLALWLLGLGERIRPLRKLVSGLREFYEGSFSLFRPGATLLAVGLGAVSWLGEGIGFYLLLIGLGLKPGWDLASLAVFTLAFSTVIGAVSALPGGLGAAEVSIAGMLTLLGGIPGAAASAGTLLIRLATLWFGVALGLCVWVFSRDLLGLQVENGPIAEG